ncbi:MAG: LysR family transcriptional regulator [Kofleriaceae bacterium]|nr:LysR family transcriptional regulator [Kofleriaceae bacterium]
MNETPNEWVGHVDLLLAAVREGSATQAAKQLGLSTATVIRRLEAMEEALGTQLFDRSSTGLHPTAALTLALPWAEQIEAAGHSLRRELSGFEKEAKGDVRVSLVEAVSSWIVAPRLPTLLERYPGLAVTLVPEARLVDLARREADIVVRLSRPNSGDLIVRKLLSFELVVVAAPCLLDACQPKRLLDLPWIDWAPSVVGTEDVLWLKRTLPEAEVRMRSTSLVTMLHAAQAGVGAIVVAAPLAEAVGGLQRVNLDTPPLPTLSMHLVTHRALRPIPRVAVVWDYLLELFGE